MPHPAGARALTMARRAYLPVLPAPRTRGDCAPGGPLALRPCPWSSCRYHLPRAAECALDVADEGPRTFAAIGVVLGVSRGRVRQIVNRALRRLAATVERDEQVARP